MQSPAASTTSFKELAPLEESVVLFSQPLLSEPEAVQNNSILHPYDGYISMRIDA